ncbi:hypothetical protein LG200_07740 [Methylobacillus caricis]|uniref:hypothetical protein n=1 Tax=Methylobacillus caricis TaxID=1971611 RepID=UPI001CFFCD3D|nr:hypothetical protein [Methylobacillus caricis]MCB5187896.1 hypothetical protein [Methylobacillus caricis]
MANNIKKTHPMVLVAATALTVFSLLGSAAITGLIPTAHTYRPDLARELITDPNATMAIGSTMNSHMSSNRQSNDVGEEKSCQDCGIVMSISSFENAIDNVYDAEKTGVSYMVKVKMVNGNFNTVMQYSKPRYSVGDQVRIRSGKLISA